MAKTVIGLFEDQSQIQQVLQELEQQGFQRNSLKVMGSGNHGQGNQQRVDVNSLTGAGVPQEDAHIYAEGVRRGGTLVQLSAPDDRAETAYEIMQRSGAVDLDNHSARWRQEEGWNSYDNNSQPYNSQQVADYRTRYAQTEATGQSNNRQNVQGETVLPVMQEELQVGKQQVQRGGVRIYTHMTEQPVQEQVQLREEHVNVERRPVNREVTEADMGAIRDGSFEVTETSEEAVVNKQARVVEEVVVNKNVGQRTETVSDNVRRTDVEVEQLGDNQTSGYSDNSRQTYRDNDANNNQNRDMR